MCFYSILSYYETGEVLFKEKYILEVYFCIKDWLNNNTICLLEIIVCCLQHVYCPSVVSLCLNVNDMHKTKTSV